MARFRQIRKGTLARHTVSLPLADGEEVKVAVRPLLDIDDDEIETKALAYAKERGVAEPKAGDPIYDRGIALHTLLLSCSDPDSADEAAVPFFDDVEQIRAGLDRDRIQWLLTAQQMWQDKCSPRQLKMSADEFVAFVVEAATSEDERPFLRLRPGLAWISMRSMAVHLVNSQELKSLSGSAYETSSSKPEKASPDGDVS